MLYAIISDVHANETALRAVIEDAASKGVEMFICLGDVVGYGPQPEETAKLVRETCAVTLAGNHDDAVSGRIDAERFIDLAHDAVRRHRESLSGENLAWLKNLPYVCSDADFTAVHGDFTEPSAFNYIDCEEAAKENFDFTDSPLLFCGHTHEPGVFLVGGSGNVYRLGPTDFTLEEGKRFIVNPGSVGYPREKDGRCVSTYVIYDSEERAVTFHELPFLVSSVMQRGTNPKRTKKRTVAAIALALSALIGLAVYFFMPKEEVSLNVSYDPSLVVKAYTLNVPMNAKRLCPNVKLSRMSDPVLFRYVFKTMSGQVIDSQTISVRQSRSKAFKVPDGAFTAEISVSKINEAGECEIKEFAPRFE